MATACRKPADRFHSHLEGHRIRSGYAMSIARRRWAYVSSRAG